MAVAGQYINKWKVLAKVHTQTTSLLNKIYDSNSKKDKLKN